MGINIKTPGVHHVTLRVADFRRGYVQLRRVLGRQQRDRRQGDGPDQQSDY